jgi:hypothetical protein
LFIFGLFKSGSAQTQTTRAGATVGGLDDLKQLSAGIFDRAWKIVPVSGLILHACKQCFACANPYHHWQPSCLAKYPRQTDDCLIRHNCNQLAPVETQIGETIEEASEWRVFAQKQ